MIPTTGIGYSFFYGSVGIDEPNCLLGRIETVCRVNLTSSVLAASSIVNRSGQIWCPALPAVDEVWQMTNGPLKHIVGDVGGIVRVAGSPPGVVKDFGVVHLIQTANGGHITGPRQIEHLRLVG